jgi:hypothetical protein
MTVGVFYLCLLLSGWFVHKAAQHRKDPDKVFYLGNVAPSGRKYVWLAFLGMLVALIVFFWPENHN